MAKGRRIIKAAIESLQPSEKKLLAALKLSVKALVILQSMEENPPLKKIALDKMDGEPVWVVSYNHDGRWGIVDSSDESVNFITENGIVQEYWFGSQYIFRYKKEIIDYTDELIKHEIQDVNEEI